MNIRAKASLQNEDNQKIVKWRVIHGSEETKQPTNLGRSALNFRGSCQALKIKNRPSRD